MYTMVLMMAMSGSGDVSSFGGRLLGGKGNCHGAAVSTAGYGYSSHVAAGCNGYAPAVASGCHGYAASAGYGYAAPVASGCSGYAASVAEGCHGGGSGFLGLGLFSGRGNSCQGGGGGFLGLRSRGSSCHGTASHSHMSYSTGCQGAMVAPAYLTSDCCGASTVVSETPATTTPAAMPGVPAVEPKKMTETPKKPVDSKPADAPKKTGDGV